MNLGYTIKKKRKDIGLTQSDLAKMCGITQTYLSQIENNAKEPNLSTIKTISEGLDIPLPILFFLSMNDDDVPMEKRDAFKLISPSINSLVHEFFKI